ncbi:protease inhibitor Inh/omp19 family protein [Oryzifoliimicrobium ureilyticus]|uniref:protease inhibitor Inh/omp19 family protein n=1 Tax=Oryzifoliimicrobium ureilyticus TaxID=3113724 RepID=UPI00307619FC
MRIIYAVAGVAAALSLASCQRTAYNDASYSSAAPAPLTAQPVPSVQGGTLPPPAGASQFPAAPTATTAPGAGAPGAAAVASNAMDVTKESMVGSWRVNGSCDMFLTLTNLGSGSRGGTRGCTGELTTMGSWEVSGKQVVLKDRSGNAIGSVYKTADNRFSGQTNSGQAINLSR